MKIQIIRSIRKTISIQVNKSANIVVKAPFFVTKNTINNFIEKNKSWIEKKREEIKKRNNNYKIWSEFLYLWEKYKIIEGNENILNKVNKNFCVLKNINSSKIKKIIDNFYKKEAEKYIIEKTKYFIEKYSLKVNSIKIGSAKWRWWSCSSKKDIRFTKYLMSAPLLSIDYVIIHELSHLREMNHSKHFWLEVERMMSDYKKYKFWFKENKWISLF